MIETLLLKMSLYLSQTRLLSMFANLLHLTKWNWLPMRLLKTWQLMFAL